MGIRLASEMSLLRILLRQGSNLWSVGPGTNGRTTVIGATTHVDEIMGVDCAVHEPDEPLRVSIQKGGRELIAIHAEAWRRLCERARPDLALLGPEVVSAYFDAFAPGCPVILLTAYRGRRLVAVLPLHEKSPGIGPFRFRWLRTAGNIPFQRFDVLYADEDPGDIATEFWRLIRESFPKHMFYVNLATVGGVASRIRDLAAAEGYMTGSADESAAPFVAITSPEESMEEFIADQKSSLRSSLRRGLKKLQSQGDVRFLQVEGTAEGKDISEWLDMFCDLENRGWKGHARTSTNAEPATRRFYRALARDEALRPLFRCSALMVGEEMIAGDVGFQIGKTRFGLKMAINEDYRKCSPGHLLCLYLLTDCARLGLSEFDLGGKTSPYKMSWTDTSHPYSSLFIFPDGWRGRVSRAIAFDVVLRTRDFLLTKPRITRLLRIGMGHLTTD